MLTILSLRIKSLAIQFVPPKQQLDDAVAVLKQNGQSFKDFNDVPLFYATGGSDKGLLIMEQNKTKVIPFFFSKQDLQNLIGLIKQKDPKQSSTMTVQVTSMTLVLGTLLKDNSAALQQFTFMPDSASLKYALQQQKAAGGNKPAAGAKPSAPAPSGASAPAAAPGAPAPQAQPSPPSKPK
jgi:hypothetical protein